LITAYFSGLLLEHFTRTVFWITLFSLIISAVAWLIAESPVVYARLVHSQKSTEVITPSPEPKNLFGYPQPLFSFAGTPSADSAFSFFTTNELGFQPEFLGRVRLVTSIASLVGVWLFQRFLKTIPFRVILVEYRLLSGFA